VTNFKKEIQIELKNLILENEKSITFSFNDERRLALLELVRAKDWDKAVFAREKHFRDELYLPFDSERFFRLKRNANLKINGKTVTDIDALIFDRETGVVGVFQLK
jgi:hypothetical protein